MNVNINSVFDDDKIYDFLLWCDKKPNNVFYKENNNSILFSYKSDREDINYLLFKFNPNDRLRFMNSNLLSEDDIVYYLKNKTGVYSTLNVSKISETVSNFKKFDNILFVTSLHPEVLNSKKIPLDWKTNPKIIENILSINEINLTSIINFSKESLKTLTLNMTDNNQIFNILSLDKKHSIIDYIPDDIKFNFDFIKSIYSSNKFDVSFKKTFFKNLPDYIRTNHSLISELSYSNLDLITLFEPKLWNNKNFVFNFFNNLPTSLDNKVSSYLPLELQNFLLKNNINSNFNNYISNYILELDLNKSNIKNNIKKLKI